MAFKLEIDQQAALNVGKGAGLPTGIHKVRITAAWLGETKGGNNTIDLEFEDKDGNKATVYGMCIDKTWKSGAENYDYGKWQELINIVGLKSAETKTIERTIYDGTKEKAESMTGLVGKVVVIALQIKYELNQDGTKEKKVRVIYRTFHKDGKSIAETQADTEAKTSVGLAKSLTDYETEAWKVWKADGGSKAKNQNDAGSDSNVNTESEPEEEEEDLL